MKKSLLIMFLMCLRIVISYAQQKDFNYWDKLVRTDKNFQKFVSNFKTYNEQALRTNYYGNDFSLIKDFDKNCAKDKATFINCLNKAGFKKSKDLADLTFSMKDDMLAFRKANPDFVKLPTQSQQKLMVKYIR